jgi:outer membrane protein assembly factor BamB
MWLSRPLLTGTLVLAALPACNREAPIPRTPVAESERQQFKDPLKTACWPEPGSWPQFAHDPLHSGRSEVELGSAELQPLWQFQPSKHVWAYEPGFSAWSSPVVGTVAGRPLVIAGYQDCNIYAADAETGRKVWEFSPGAPVFASPALAVVHGRPMVLVASMNRFIYGLDAANGEQIWQYETVPWSFTLARSVMSSPTVIDDAGTPLLLIGAWNGDRSATNNLQSGECLAIDVTDGKLRWRERLGSVPVTSLAVATIQGEHLVFVASQNGALQARRVRDGSLKWESVLDEETRSSPSLGLVDGSAEVFIGSRLNCLFGLDAGTGKRRWRVSTGYWVDSTPAWFGSPVTAGDGANTTIVVGSYDRSFYAWQAEPVQRRWKTLTGNYAYSSTAIATLRGKPVVLASSWDQHLYLFDGLNGQVLWKAASGPLLWSHAYMGDSLWASPVVARVAGKPSVFFGALDGILYAYRPRLSPESRPLADR